MVELQEVQAQARPNGWRSYGYLSDVSLIRRTFSNMPIRIGYLRFLSHLTPSGR
jgi:hypothetical protein